MHANTRGRGKRAGPSNAKTSALIKLVYTGALFTMMQQQQQN